MQSQQRTWKKMSNWRVSATAIAALGLVPAWTASHRTDPNLVSAFLKGQTVEANLLEMAKDPETQAADLGEQAPWSGSFLPARAGYAANPYRESGSRYANLGFNENFIDWNQVRFPDLASRLPSLAEGEIQYLAPSEKYDLLIGSFGRMDSLTARLWFRALEVRNTDGSGDLRRKQKLVSWTGLCHGFAPVSTIYPRPKKTLDLISVAYPNLGGKRFVIPFFPDDLKALATVGYANSYTAQTSLEPKDWTSKSGIMPMTFQRCDDKKPKRDRSGRIEKTECLDTDPGFWHLAATHLLGKRKRGFVVDYDYNAPVNNHAVRGFSVQYFNPMTGKNGSLEESRIERGEATARDLFAGHRLAETHSIVGVEMKLVRVDYRDLSARRENSQEDDRVSTHTLIYDLELDRDGKILGGEWRTSRKSRLNPFLGIRGKKPYPDFIWWVPEDVRAYAWVETGNDGIFDPIATEWKAGEPIPEELAERAREAAKNEVVWAVQGKPEGNRDIHPQIPYQFIEPLMQRANRE